ncbi:MAG: SGNH/GDSL hydrolase family protein [Cyanobacteria bacterium P01_D01_bin.1]
MGSSLSHTKVVEAAPSDELTGITTAFNVALDNELDGLSVTLPDAQIALLDVSTLFTDELLIEFAQTVQSCVQGPPLAPASEPTSICINPSEYLFFDEIHPTATAHSAIGERAIEAVDQSLSEEVIAGMTGLFIFGDSLSDRGNVFAFSGSTFPFPVAVQGPLSGSPLYVDGRFTNGPVWWEPLAQHFNLTNPHTYYQEKLSGNTPNLSDGSINFSVGGATTGTDNAGNAQNPPFPSELPGLQDQIDAFEALTILEGGADPAALYVIWAGANNFLGAFIPTDRTNPFGPFTDFTTDPTAPATDIAMAVEELYNLGARNFLVANMYDIGNTPLARDIDLLFP